MNQYPALIVIVPLLLAFGVIIAAWLKKKADFSLSILALGVSFISSILLLSQVLTSGAVSYRLGGWAPPVGIEYYVDALNGIVLVLISGIALFNLLASRQSIEQHYQSKAPVFYSLYLLSVAGHLGLVITGDAFNLYVLLEISALTGYSLLAMGSKNAPLSTLRYLFMGTVGASFYLLGVGYLYIMTGSLNMQDLAQLLPNLYSSPTIIAAFGLILLGVWVKMAFFPMHSWLPNAYSDAHNPASSLIAPMTTKVMVYVMIRMMLTVFTPEFTFKVENISSQVVWLAVLAIVAGSFFALAQRDLKKMLTFILISEVGYMVGGAWLGNRIGMTGAVLHIINDAVMTFCVFLAASSIAQKTGSLKFGDLQGLFKKMPFTMGALVVGALAMIGVPPTCGFFSKWYLILGGIEAGHYGFVAALILSSLINIVLFFRIFEISFFEPFTEGHHGHEAVAIQESSWNMVVVLLVSAVALVLLGLYSGPLVTNIIDLAIPANFV